MFTPVYIEVMITWRDLKSHDSCGQHILTVSCQLYVFYHQTLASRVHSVSLFHTGQFRPPRPLWVHWREKTHHQTVASNLVSGKPSWVKWSRVGWELRPALQLASAEVMSNIGHGVLSWWTLGEKWILGMWVSKKFLFRANAITWV